NREAVDAGWSGMELHLDAAVSARIRGRLLALSTCFHVVFLLAGGSASFSRSRTLRGRAVEAGQDGRPGVSRLWRFGTSRRVGLPCGSARSATACAHKTPQTDTLKLTSGTAMPVGVNLTSTWPVCYPGLVAYFCALIHFLPGGGLRCAGT